jgi:ankyrin repeat protein
VKKAVSAVTVFCILAFPAAQGGFAAQNELSERDFAVREELAEAIRREDLSPLRALLDAGADPNTVVHGRSLLAGAVREGNVPAVQLLLERGADPNRADAEGLTAAHHTAMAYNGQDPAILRLLAAAGARFDVLDGGKRTPLQMTAREGEAGFSFILAWEQENVPGFSGSFGDRKSYLASLWDGSDLSAVIGALLDAGEPVDGTGRRGRNAAWYAAGMYGSAGPPLTGRLMEAGVRFDITDSEGVSPLYRSLNRSDTEVFMMILRWEEANSPGFAGAAANRGLYLAAAAARLWNRDRRGEELKALLAAGADPAALISGKEVSLGDIRGDYVPLLLENGTPVNIQDKDGRTFLMEAAGRLGDRGQLVRYLLEAKADPAVRDKEGRTALMEARESGAARLLLDYGADPGAADHNGRTALHHGYYREKELPALLIEAGADIEAPDNWGLTPFLYAAARYGKTWGLRGAPQGMADLLDLGADPNKKSPENKTALLLYLEDSGLDNAFPSMVQRLLDAGVDPAEKDSSGNSPLLTALRSKSDRGNVREIRDMLVSAADKEQAAAAKSAVRAERRRDFAEDFPGRLAAAAPFLLLPAYIGVSVWTREGTYRDNPGSNWMGTANAFVTGFGAGALLGFFTFGKLGGSSLERELFAFLVVAPIGGLIGGIAMAAVPPVRSAFKENPFLYYLPSATAGVVFTIAVVQIWLD